MATQAPPGDDAVWLDPAEMRAWRTFIDASNRLDAVLNKSLSDNHDLALADYRILVLLSEADDFTLRMSELADGVVASRSKLTHQVRRLEATGMVTRVECDSDRRGVNAVLTESGLGRLKAAAPGHAADVRRYMIDALTGRQLRMLTDVFGTVDARCREVTT